MGTTVGCGRQKTTLVFPNQEIALARERVGEQIVRLETVISSIEQDMGKAIEPPSQGLIPSDDLHFVRFSLVECFVSPVCRPDDPRGICVELEQKYSAQAELPMGLAEREPVFGYRNCPVRDGEPLRAAAATWSPDAQTWFVERIRVIDALRVRLRAIIPDRAAESEAELDALDQEVRQTYIEAEDRWRYSLRQEARSETRRAEEARWERFLDGMRAYDEELARVKEYREELRRFSQRDVLNLVVRLSTLGEPLF